MSNIKVYSQYGDPRRLAAGPPDAFKPVMPGGDDTPHGLTAMQAEQLKDRFESFLPQLSSSSSVSPQWFDGLMPEGGNLSPTAGAGYRKAVANTQRQAAGTLGLPSGPKRSVS